jgi:hypothetical protein
LIFDHYLENNQSLILHPLSLAVGSNMMLVSPFSSNRLPVQKGPLSICFEANRIILHGVMLAKWAKREQRRNMGL